MRVVIIGTGYVGLVQGVCLAELGNQVTCVDVDENKIKKLNQGVSPIYEPGIEEMVAKNMAAGRLKFDSKLKKNLKDNELIFIAVGTPSQEDGRADLKYVRSAAEDIGRSLSGNQVIVNKSTVPIGTGQMVKKIIKQYYKGKFSVVSNPEFLKEGSAIDDFMHPDRIVIGYDQDREAAEKVAKLYEVLESPILITNLEAAEMIKYASNSYLATQISFINSVAEICEKVGADVTEVSAGMKLDSRIGKKAFLNAGLGYGGSCFPKDVQALVQIAKDSQADFKILEEVELVNKMQRQRFVLKIKKTLGQIKGKKIGIWGVAFKPKTDDIREAPSISIIEALQDLGATLVAFDSVAEENSKRLFPELKFAKNPFEATTGVDALVIITEWDEFKQIDLKKIKLLMKQPLVFDGRNIYNPREMKKLGFQYHSIGR